MPDMPIQVYLNERVRRMLKEKDGKLQRGGVIAIGGGGGSCAECKYAYEHGVPVAYVQCEGKFWKNEDGSEKKGGKYGPVNTFVQDLEINPSNENEQGLYDGIWMIKPDTCGSEQQPNQIREETSIPVMQCIFPITIDEEVDCIASKDGKYKFFKVWHHVLQKVKAHTDDAEEVG